VGGGGGGGVGGGGGGGGGGGRGVVIGGGVTVLPPSPLPSTKAALQKKRETTHTANHLSPRERVNQATTNYNLELKLCRGAENGKRGRLEKRIATGSDSKFKVTLCGQYLCPTRVERGCKKSVTKTKDEYVLKSGHKKGAWEGKTEGVHIQKTGNRPARTSERPVSVTKPSIAKRKKQKRECGDDKAQKMT